MSTTSIIREIPTLLEDEKNDGPVLEVEIIIEDGTEGALVRVGNYNIMGSELIALGKLIERNLND